MLKKRAGYSAALSASIVGVSLLLWNQFRAPFPDPAPLSNVQDHQSIMLDLQNSLAESPNDAESWFKLGQLYMQSLEFDSAATCFNYSIRLSSMPYAGQYAALATALYYQSSQTITPDIQRYLDKALELDSDNDTALQLIASDYFLNAEYDEAIRVWTQILDSNRVGIDRAALVEKINQAKGMR
ncbi:TPR domain-containing protein [Vibrio sp. 10N]|uniref:TPR domain-containing protein n=1 Tax=Vibrio sp. 10N TaxID=3058938 RepID=UPI0030C66A65